MIRRTWTAGQIASVARLYYPAPDMKCRDDSALEGCNHARPLETESDSLRARQHAERAHLDDRSAAAHAHEQFGSRVAENPAELVVYGGIGRAARDWNCFDRIVETLKN